MTMMLMMDSRVSGSGGGGWCVSRYESEKMDRIMLRFRPIAPKPTAAGSSPENTSGSRGEGDTFVKIGRGKRRCKNSNFSSNCDQKNSSSKRRKSSPEAVTTRPLLSEVNETILKRSAPIWLNFNSGAAEKDEVDQTVEKHNNNNNHHHHHHHHRPIYYAPDPTVVTPPRGNCGTCVTLQCLTYTMVNVDALGTGRTDNERMMNLEHDTCPGFISDRLSRITWSNAAFKKLVAVDHNTVGGWVAMKESVGMGVKAFSCRVRVQADDNKTRKSKTMTVPCDVWRMNCGGFAWRLDVRAALSLAL